jgi:proteic killer suppression protein
MIVTFKEKYLRDLYETGKTADKKRRFQPDIVERYRKRIKTLNDAARIEDLSEINSLNYEVLKGDKQGISSIRINKQYRIEFTVTNISVDPLITVCNILDLSNHYK